jgi:hypothetical protein
MKMKWWWWWWWQGWIQEFWIVGVITATPILIIMKTRKRWASIHAQSIQTSFDVSGYDPKTSVHHL